jgi:acetyl esterase
MARMSDGIRRLVGDDASSTLDDGGVSDARDRDPRLRLDPELAAITVLIPDVDLTEIVSARELETRLMAQGRNPLPGVVTTNTTAPRRDGGDIPVRVYRPQLGGRLPVILYIHGGGFVLGGLGTEDDRCEFYARDAECVVVAVDYRLAPEHPFPAGFDDCLDVLAWISAEASKLRVDPRRLVVGGNSAGGALAAAVALASRAPDVPTLIHQVLINPMLDHRSATASMAAFGSTPGWHRAANELVWGMYLGDTAPDERAAPILAADVTGAPPASIWIAEYDPLRDEGYDYAARLMAAGVQVGLIQYPGTIHGFDSYRMTKIGQRALHDQVSALRSAFRR